MLAVAAYQYYVQELQAEINQDVMSAMDEVEFHDQFRFGKYGWRGRRSCAIRMMCLSRPRNGAGNLQSKARNHPH